jgi:ribose transport system substrate-binding protein
MLNAGRRQCWIARLRTALPLLLAGVALLSLSGCQRNSAVAIAVIPRTCGTIMWEPEHSGAQATALKLGARIYWNAPTREDDVEGQIALVERVSSENYQGIVLAPDQARSLITPIRRAMQRGLSIVVVGSPLPVPAGERLSYILNDDEAGGRIAGQRIAAILHGTGSVAILGIDSDITGIMTRARSLEEFLARNYPRIRIIKRTGSFNVPHEQQVAEETLKGNPDLDAVVALTATSTFGALSALGNVRSGRQIRIVGFDPDSLNFDNPHLDSIVIEDTQKMGVDAVRQVVAQIHGQSGPLVTQCEPLLVTRENVHSAEVSQLTSMDWRPENLRRTWGAAKWGAAP